MRESHAYENAPEHARQSEHGSSLWSKIMIETFEEYQRASKSLCNECGGSKR